MQKYGDDFGSVKVVPPASWKPAFAPWRSGARFNPKIQQLGMVSGENRQEIAFEEDLKMRKYLSGEPFRKGARPVLSLPNGEVMRVKLRKLRILLDLYGSTSIEAMRFCMQRCIVHTQEPPVVTNELINQITVLMNEWFLPVKDVKEDTDNIWYSISKVPSSLPPRKCEGPFWMYDPVNRKYSLAKLTGKSFISNGVMKLGCDLECPISGRSTLSNIDAVDADSYIANGFSKESSRFATNCLLCEVCSIACHFPVEVSDIGDDIPIFDPPTEPELNQLRIERPSLTCSACSKVVHADCIPVSEFVSQAILHHLIREQRDWFCNKCLDANRSAALNYGYQKGPEMTRRDFERKSNIFSHKNGINTKKQTVDEIERKFWSIFDADGAEDLSVLYASDLDSKQVAGGEFSSQYNSSNSWDLRILALNQASVLRNLPDSGKIPGVARPWMYLGSTLSSFCWHTEDQFLCSISYLHEGAPKVWYTIPGSCHKKIESAFRDLLPDLGTVNQDLHHQLVTMLDPAVLSSYYQIPVARAVQHPREFIITFPQAYHAGFNTGLNLAEAVNVAIPEWLPFGRLAVTDYAKVRRPSVFSIEELVWNISCNGMQSETRHQVVAFCIAVLEEAYKQCREASNPRASAVNCPTAVCEVCNQYCYFLWLEQEDEKFCASCTSKGARAKTVIRFAPHDIMTVIELLRIKLKSCVEIRRSTRPSKRYKPSNNGF